MGITFSFLIFSSFLILIFLGIPIAYAMIIISFCFILLSGGGLASLVLPFIKLGEGISFSLAAVFLFITFGNAMNETNIANYLIVFVKGLFKGFLKNGRTGAITIFGCMLCGPMTGSANATTTSIGVIMIPQMNKVNYDKKYSTALLAYSGILGSLIPPSITGLVYALIVNLPILGVWMAVCGVGLLYGLSLFVCHMIIAKKRGYDSLDIKEVEPKNGLYIKEVEPKNGLYKSSFINIKGVIAFVVPIGVFASIYSGIATPVEAASIGILISMLLGIFYYKTINSFKQFIEKIIYKSSYQTAVIMFLVCASFSLNYALTACGSIKDIVNFIILLTNNKYILLLLVEGLLTITGCFMDDLPIMILLAPIASTILTPFGVHPYHLAGIIVFTSLVGVVTPPVGAVIYAASTISGVSVSSMFRELIIFFIPALIVLLLLTFFPCITLFLPKLFGLL